MSLTHRVYEWVAGRPLWQQELFLRAVSGPPLSDGDTDAFLDLVIGRPSTITPRSIRRGDLPADLNPGSSISLLSVEHCEGVNRLAAGEELRLIARGMNVVYGQNGSGKSGWARIPKHAGRAHTVEPVLGDVFRDEADRPDPRAEIRWQLADEERRTTFRLREPAPADLAGMYVFDAEGGVQLLTADHEIDYVPLALTAMQRLRASQASLVERADKRIVDLSQNKLDLSPFNVGSKVRTALEGLSAKTDLERVREHALMTPAERERQSELTRQLAEIASRNTDALVERCEREAEQIEKLTAALAAAAMHLSHEAVEAAQKERRTLDAARAAADAMSASRFASEPLGGVGSGAWATLWEAARRFVAEGHQQEFPPAHDPAYCPLCMQKLDVESRERLARFDEFIRSDVENRLGEAKTAIARRLDALPSLAQLKQANDAALRLIEDRDELRQSVTEWLLQLDAAVLAMRDAESTLVSLVSPPRALLEQMSHALRSEADERRRLKDPAAEAAIRVELAELQDRDLLSKALSGVEARVGEFVEIERLRQAKEDASARAVSVKIGSLTKEFVTEDLEQALREQLRHLNFHDLEVVGCRTSGRDGSPRVGLRVKATGNVSIRTVLSDGEQRRLALAFFLAEVAVAAPGQPLILDDPVCSVDHLGRRHIARTLARLAKDRQIVIFTHELAFVHELQVAATNHGVQLAAQHVARANGLSGHVRPELPWLGKTAEKRRNALSQELQSIEAHFRGKGCDEGYEARTRKFCESLREALERAIEDCVIGSVVTRSDPGVHPKQLKNVAWSEEICALADRGLAETSPWAHDSSRAQDPSPPTPDELGEGLEILRQLISATVDVKNERKAAAREREQVPGAAVLGELEVKAS